VRSLAERARRDGMLETTVSTLLSELLRTVRAPKSDSNLNSGAAPIATSCDGMHTHVRIDTVCGWHPRFTSMGTLRENLQQRT
jgi:hypothetical protein